MRVAGAVILFVYLLFVAVFDASGQSEADMRAYELTAKAAEYIRSCRYGDASKMLEEADGIDGVFPVTKLQLRCAMIRVAIAIGDYKRAESLYYEALANSPDEECDDMLRLIGSEIYFMTGEYKRALALTDSLTTSRYRDIGLLHRVRALTMLERYDDAIAAADSAIAALPQNSENHSVALQNRGYAYWAMERLDKAVEDLQMAAGEMADSSDRYNMLGNLALAESESGNHDAALKHISESIRHLPAGSSDGIVARRKFAEILYASGRIKESSREFKVFFRRERAGLVANLGQMPPAQKLNYWAKEKPLLSRCFVLGDNEAEFLFEVAMFRRQTSLLGMRDTTGLKQLLAVTPAEVRRALKDGEVAVEIVRYEPQRNFGAYAAIILPKKGRARFVPLVYEFEIYEPGTVGRYSLYDALKTEDVEAKNLLYTDLLWGNRIWMPIMSALPQGAKTIFFAPEGIFHLWGIENMPFEGKEGREFRRITSVASIVERNGNDGKDNVRGLVIGGLDYNAMPEDGGVQGVSNHEAAEYLMERMGHRAIFGYLKGTMAESDSISLLNGAYEVRHSISEAEFKSVVPTYDLVHIATHGYSLNFGIRKRPEFLADSVVVDRSLLASGLALSGANTAYRRAVGEDGIISAREICDLDLSRVDFVVLSACQTAKGDISDEGAAGIVRGLKTSGVKTVMATLWEVDDMSTMLFMQEFYRQLEEGANRYDSFLAAQKRVRETPTRVAYRKFSAGTMAADRNLSYREIPPFSQPFYWAPFILIDEY